MAFTNVYRVSYTFRASKDGNPQEKVAFVVADTDRQATDYINSLLGHDVMGASTHVSKAILVSGAIGKAVDERRIGAVDNRPLPKVERRHGAPDTRNAEPALKSSVKPAPVTAPGKPVERRVAGAIDPRPLPRTERRHGAPDTRPVVK